MRLHVQGQVSACARATARACKCKSIQERVQVPAPAPAHAHAWRGVLRLPLVGGRQPTFPPFSSQKVGVQSSQPFLPECQCEINSLSASPPLPRTWGPDPIRDSALLANSQSRRCPAVERSPARPSMYNHHSIPRRPLLHGHPIPPVATLDAAAQQPLAPGICGTRGACDRCTNNPAATTRARAPPPPPHLLKNIKKKKNNIKKKKKKRERTRLNGHELK